MAFTNRELLRRLETLNRAAAEEEFTSTKVRYAVTKNLKRLERALSAYREEKKSLLEEHGVDLEGIKQEGPEEEGPEGAPDLPEEFIEEHEKLLQAEDGGEYEPYQVTEDYLDKEEIPMELMIDVDWLFERKS
jgi:hypothetical protein